MQIDAITIPIFELSNSYFIPIFHMKFVISIPGGTTCTLHQVAEPLGMKCTLILICYVEHGEYLDVGETVGEVLISVS